MKSVFTHEIEFRRWSGRKGVWMAGTRPNRTERWIRLIYGVKFYPYRVGEFE